MSVERILLTNDDGIDAVGLGAMYDELSTAYEVTVVAPTDDRSAIGRAISREADVHDHELGYAVDGTPVDCVIAGLSSLVHDVDAVVAGCNKGANLGEYVLGRSGTVSAAVEATFFGVPAIATSMYVPGDDDWWQCDLDANRFRHATTATRFLIEAATDSEVFDAAEYLNINAPIVNKDSDAAATSSSSTAPMRVTRPSPWYGMTAEHNGDGSVAIHDRIWDHMHEGDVPDPVGTDRRAVLDGEVSVSPLSAPHTLADDTALKTIVSGRES